MKTLLELPVHSICAQKSLYLDVAGIDHVF